MKARTKLLLFKALIVLSPSAYCWEYEGELFAQTRYFSDDPLHAEQGSESQSLTLEFTAYKQFSRSTSFEFTPYYRHDFQDDERSHGDIRSAYFLWTHPKIELGIGVNKVFWGVTEAQHLVDIINQTDSVEAPDQEEKLGQAMLNMSFPLSSGLLDIYVMPYFRERTFAGEAGRLRTQVVVDTDNPVYEHDDEEHHLDWGLRLKRSLAQTEIALSYFKGTGRDPSFIPAFTASGPALLPYYPQITQFGLEFQYIQSQWLWKLESIYRQDQPNLQFEQEDYYALTGGFEYNFYSILDTAQDLGIILEGLYDERGDQALTINEEDIAAGVRWALNDLNSTELLALWIQDVDSSARYFVLEFSMEYGSSVAITIEALMFSQQPGATGPIVADNLAYSLRDDDYLQIEIGYFF